MEKAMKFVLLSIAVSGIDVLGTLRLSLMLFLAVLYIFICMINILKNIACSSHTLTWTYAVSEIIKCMALLTWLVTFKRRQNILKLLQYINDFHKFVHFKGTSNIYKYSTLASIFLMMYPTLTILYHSFFTYTYFKKDIGCYWFKTIKKTLNVDAVEIAMSLINNTYLRFADTTLMTICCFSITTSLQSKPTSKSEAIAIYKKFFNLVRLLHACTSPLLFTVICQTILITFRLVATLFEDFVTKFLPIHRKIYIATDFTLNFLLILILVIAYETVYNKIDEIRRYILESDFHSNPCLPTAFYVRLIEDRKYLKPTALGLFRIHNSLLLTYTTSIITYGFLIYQLYYA